MALNRCIHCLMPDTRPRMQLDEVGMCNACAEQPYEPPNWVQRKNAFLELVKMNSRHPAYDCIVPFSGGKDSAMIAFKLKHELGLNPLLVCYGQMIWTGVGRFNFDQVRKAGLDCFYFAMNQEVSRTLCRRFFIERGHPKAHYDAAINSIPVIVSRDMGIPLIVYAEHGDTEYGGHIMDEDSARRRTKEEVLEHCVGDDARNWVMDGVTERDLYPYIYPDDVENKSLAVYYSYYFGWDIYENAKFARDVLGFRQARHGTTPMGAVWDWGKTDGSFEGFDSIDDCIDGLDFWMMYLKFGFGRATRMAGRMIRNGHLETEQAEEWIAEFDDNPPDRHMGAVLGYLGMDESELMYHAHQHEETF